MTDTDNENFRTTEKKSKKMLDDGENIYAHGLGELKLFMRMVTLPKINYGFTEIFIIFS